MSALFDANDYGPEREPRKVAVREPVVAVAVLSETIWKGVSRRQHGVVHAITNRPPAQIGGKAVLSSSSVSYCGVFVERHTYGADEVVPGCKKCIDRGALHARAGAL